MSTIRKVKIFNKEYPLKGLATLLGVSLFLISCAIDFTYANLNTYIISYLRQYDKSYTYSDWAYVGTFKTIITGVYIPFAGEISRRIGLKLSLIIGSVIYCAGIILTGFSLDVGLWLVIITLAGCHGFSFAMTYAQAIEISMSWFPAEIGFMTSFALAGYGFGGVIWNPVETAFVNPDNLSPDEEVGDDLYFTQKELLDKIPKLFFLLGGIFAIMEIIVLFIIFVPNKEEKAELSDLKFEFEKLESKSEEVEEHYSVKPKHVIKTPEFYKMWYTFLSISMVNGFISSYSKPYGQQYISDDKFLASVATFSSVMNGACRIVWGKIFDHTGYQFCLVTITGLCATLLFSFNCLAGTEDTGSKVFYAIWVSLIYGTYPGVYSTLAPGIMRTFGSKHYSANYGLVYTQNIAYSILNLVLVKAILDLDGGYFIMFTIIGCMNVIAMLVTMTFPRERTSDDFKEIFSN